MIVKNGEIIAINSVKTDNTLTGDGVRQVLGLNTTAVIDPIKADISAVSSKISEISADIVTIHNDITNIYSGMDVMRDDINDVSGEISGIKSDITNIYNNIDVISGDINNIYNNISTISGEIVDINLDIDHIYNNIHTISGEIIGIHDDISVLSASATLIAEALLDETEERMEADDYLSAAIDTKQNILSAGEFIDIDENDTISVTGLKPVVYFSAPFNKHVSAEYFTFDGSKLSANEEIGFFNLSIGYAVNGDNTCIDNYYSACIKVNNTLVDTHYINGEIPFENHYISKNVLNDAVDNLYEFTIEKDNELNISNMNISCIGFIGSADDASFGVLGSNNNILTFGNTILRV